MTQYFSSSRSSAAGSTLLIFLMPAIQATGQPTVPSSVDARTWILIDYASGKVLTGGSADERLGPVSLTKIMTSYVVGQVLKVRKVSPNDMVTAGKDAQTTGNPALRGLSVMFLRPGDQVVVSDLSKDVVIQLGNDTYIVLANYVVGSQKSFVGLMNGYAKKLGLTNTIFRTVHGLNTAGQFSTTRDMALLGKASIHDIPERYAIHKEKKFTFNKIRQPNRNCLLWSTNLNVDGIKTGITTGARYNLVTSTIQDDMRLISVVLEAKTGHIRFNKSEKLLTWDFRFFEIVTPIKPDATSVTQRVWFGDKSEVNLGTGEGGSVAIPHDQLKNLETSFTLTEPQLTVPLKKDRVADTINFQLNGKSIEQRPLVVMEGVEEDGFFNHMQDFVMMKSHQWFGG